jgi:hypothetical protein
VRLATTKKSSDSCPCNTWFSWPLDLDQIDKKKLSIWHKKISQIIYM